MVAMTTPLQQTLARDHVVKSSSRAYAEFNCNRYFSVVASNTVEDYDADLFPIESIVLPDRPQKAGIVKAFLGDANDVWTRNQSTADSMYNTEYTSGPRYYYCSPSDKYTYWVSPTVSALTITTGYAIANVAPKIIYSVPVAANKITIGLENSWASPVTHAVDITLDGTNWVEVSLSPTVNSNGRINLYLQNNDTWSTTVNLANSKLIRGIRYRVTSINQKNSRLNVIEIGARMESDITPYLIDYSYEASVSDHSFVTPLGKVSSNVGSINLSNATGVFNNDNPASPFAGMIDENVEIRVDTGIDTTAHAGSAYTWTRVMTMRTEAWRPSDIDAISIGLKDDSKALQAVKPSPTLFDRSDAAMTKDGYSHMTVGEVVWRILDSVGFANYEYDAALDNETSVQIPFFWVDGEKTVWEVFNELAEATQTAIYFDRDGVLQIKTMSAAYSSTAQPVWDFTSGDVSAEKALSLIDSTKLSDIINIEPSYDYEANTVNVKYRNTTMTDQNSVTPAMEVVWEPEATTVLRAASLSATLSSGGTSFKISPTSAAVWPYTGVVQIQGEFIRYDAKRYNYYTGAGTLITNRYISTAEEKASLDALNPALSFKNHFTGEFRIQTRALWNTQALAHTVGMASIWNWHKYRIAGGTVVNWTGGVTMSNSRMIRTTNPNFGANAWYISTTGSSPDVAPTYYGTRMYYPTSGYTFGAAGIVIGADTNDSGIYVELARTSAIASTRTTQNEVNVYVKYSNGTIKRYGTGTALAVNPGTWYDLDVKITGGASQLITVKVNGSVVLSVTIPNAQLPNPAAVAGRAGMFTRGFTSVHHEYFYMVANPINDAFDQEGWYDRVNGGFQSGQWDREWVFGYQTKFIVRGKTKTAIQARNAQRLFDDFGPIVHELREMDVKFSKAPVVHSRVYFSNDYQVICPEYLGDAFGAKFLLANTARVNAIVSGEDTLTFGVDNPVDQKLFIYGRTISQADEQTLTVKDDLAIKKRGITEVDIGSPWIQSKSAAQRVADWIVANWSGGVSELSLAVFGNPLINLGDVVTVTNKYSVDPSSPKYIDYEKYYVVEIQDGGGNEGLSTSLTLRRVKN